MRRYVAKQGGYLHEHYTSGEGAPRRPRALTGGASGASLPLPASGDPPGVTRFPEVVDSRQLLVARYLEAAAGSARPFVLVVRHAVGVPTFVVDRDGEKLELVLDEAIGWREQQTQRRSVSQWEFFVRNAVQLPPEFPRRWDLRIGVNPFT